MKCTRINVFMYFVLICIIEILVVVYLLRSNGENRKVLSLRYLGKGHDKKYNSNFTADNSSPPDLTQYTYIINNKEICVSTKPLTAIILVTTHARNLLTRQRHREVYPQQELDQFNIRRVFLLAVLDSNNTSKQPITMQNDILKENIKYSDILQFNFTENFRKLTIKNLLGLKWAVSFCQNAIFIIKIDDDTLMDLYQIINFLNLLDNNNDLIIGRKYIDMEPVRHIRNKYYVSYNEYKFHFFPEYLRGSLYIMSLKTAEKLLKASKIVPYFFIEDVYITGMLGEKVGVSFLDLVNWFVEVIPFDKSLHCCKDGSLIYLCEFVVGQHNEGAVHRATKAHAAQCYYQGGCDNRPTGLLVDNLTCV